MKINWGWRLIIVYLIFIAVTLSMMYFTTTINTDKVIDNYYEAEINYQQQIDKLERTERLVNKPVIETDEFFIKISYPNDYYPTLVSGFIKLYRPNDRTMDIKVPVILDSNRTQVIPAQNIAKGKWIVEVDWSYQNITYYNQKKIMLE